MTTELKTVIDVEPKHSVTLNNVHFAIYHAEPGQGVGKHEHLYAHATFCPSGKIKINKENLEVFMDKNSNPVMLSGETWHQIEAVEEGTVFVNVWAIGNPG